MLMSYYGWLGQQAFAALSESTHIYGRRLVLEWAAIDEDVETLREKTAHQFKAGSNII